MNIYKQEDTIFLVLNINKGIKLQDHNAQHKENKSMKK